MTCGPLEPVWCTGGVSYFVVRGDCKVYRCLYNPEVLGDLASFDRLDAKRMKCLHKESHVGLGHTCHPSGDLMFATWWDRSGARHVAPWAAKKWVEGASPEEAERRSAFFVCLPVDSKCNFRCRYCCNFYHELTDGTVVGRPRDHWSDAPIDAWDGLLRFVEGLDYARCGFLGGEPTLYSHLPELAARLVERGVEVEICSNMSSTKTVSKICDECQSRRKKDGLLSFSASLHPSSPGFSWRVFLESVSTAVASGARVRATMVSWPEQMRLYHHCKARLEKTAGVSLWLKPLGGYESSPEERAFVEAAGPSSTPEALEKLGWIPFADGRLGDVGEGRESL